MNTTTTVAVIAAIAVVGALGYHLGQRSTQQAPTTEVTTVQQQAATPAPAASPTDPHAGLPVGGDGAAGALQPPGHRFAQQIIPK